MKTAKPRVIPNNTAKTPGSKWVVEGLRDQKGARIRKFFGTRDEGDEWLRKKRVELSQQGRAAMDLNDAQRVDAVRALAILAEHQVNLTVAAEAFHKRALMLKKTVTFGVLREQMIAAKKADRNSTSYVADLRTRLSGFGQAFDGRPVASIETREIDDWLRALTLSPTSRSNYRKVLMTAFAFAISRGYAGENPVVKTARVRAVTAPGILTPTEVAALLSVADSRIVVSIALSAFAGIRDAEVGRLTWDKVNLAEGHIVIDAQAAKTDSRRIVPILDNLRAWMGPAKDRSGPVRPTQRTTYLLYQQAKKKAVALLQGEGKPSASAAF